MLSLLLLPFGTKSAIRSYPTARLQRPSQNRTCRCRGRSVARMAVGEGLSVSAFPRYVPDLEPPSTQSPFARPVGYPLARQVSNLLDGVSFAWRTVRFVRLAFGLRPVRGAPSGQSSSMGVGCQTRSVVFGVPVPSMIRIHGQDARATGRAANWVRFTRFVPRRPIRRRSGKGILE